MSDKDDIVNTINSFGLVGIKKTELKKQYVLDNFDILLNELTQEDKICISKKGTFIFCWGKEFFLEYILNSDFKFKYLYKDITAVQNKIDNYSDSIFKYVENLESELKEIKNSFNKIENKLNDIHLKPGSDSSSSSLTIDEFKESFNHILRENSTSIGWVELSSIKNEICQICNISESEYYDYVRSIAEAFPEKYELSSGGFEGVVLRGIVHGFVRCI